MSHKGLTEEPAQYPDDWENNHYSYWQEEKYSSPKARIGNPQFGLYRASVSVSTSSLTCSHFFVFIFRQLKYIILSY